MEFQRNRFGSLYIEVNELRITYIPADARAIAKNWPGQDILRIQTFQDESHDHFETLESPINDSDLMELVGELAILRKAVKNEAK